MDCKKIKTVKGYKALAKILAELGVSDHAMDLDVLKEVPTPKSYPYTPYTYSPGTKAFWKGSDNKYYSWPEVSQLKYEIHELITD